jgi:hypothetical protein
MKMQKLLLQKAKKTIKAASGGEFKQTTSVFGSN